MRVITGIYKGRRLKGPVKDELRPTSDRVKEAIFNVLAGCIEGARVLDMFAGTGNLGIESLSRGASHVHFIDQSTGSLRLLRYNLGLVGAGAAQFRVIAGDAFRAVERLGKADTLFNVIFVDPPYRKGLAGQALDALASARVFAGDCVVVAECDSKEPQPVNESFSLFRVSEYGDTSIYYFRPKPLEPLPTGEVSGAAGDAGVSSR